MIWSLLGRLAVGVCALLLLDWSYGTRPLHPWWCGAALLAYLWSCGLHWGNVSIQFGRAAAEEDEEDEDDGPTVPPFPCRPSASPFFSADDVRPEKAPIPNGTYTIGPSFSWTLTDGDAVASHVATPAPERVMPPEKSKGEELSAGEKAWLAQPVAQQIRNVASNLRGLRDEVGLSGAPGLGAASLRMNAQICLLDLIAKELSPPVE